MIGTQTQCLWRVRPRKPSQHSSHSKNLNPRRPQADKPEGGVQRAMSLSLNVRSVEGNVHCSSTMASADRDRQSQVGRFHMNLMAFTSGTTLTSTRVRRACSARLGTDTVTVAKERPAKWVASRKLHLPKEFYAPMQLAILCKISERRGKARKARPMMRTPRSNQFGVQRTHRQPRVCAVQ